MRVQLVTVTGQETRSYRRRPLLRSADAVVFVCDSRTEHIDYNRQRLLLLQRYLREQLSPAPYLIQANKQDLPGALSPNELLAALRWKQAVPVVPAVASQSKGVTETFQQAARAAARHAQSIISERGLSSVAGTPETADGVLDKLLALEDRIDGLEPEPADGEPSADEEQEHLCAAGE